jgi:hypothetical protein
MKDYSELIIKDNYKLYLFGYTNIDKFLLGINENCFLKSECFVKNEIVGNFSFIIIFNNIIHIGCFGHQRIYINYEKNKYVLSDKYNKNGYNDLINFYQLISITKNSYVGLYLTHLIYEKYFDLTTQYGENLDIYISNYEKKLEEITKDCILYSIKFNKNNITRKKYKVKILKETSDEFKNINEIVNNFHSKFKLKNNIIYPELDIDLILYICKINEIYENIYLDNLHNEMINFIVSQKGYFIIYDI